MQVTLHTPDTIYTPRHVPSWLLLACAAGFVNGFAFLACQQFVTHVTGTMTRAGLEVMHLGIAAEYVIVFVSFVVGAVAAVVVTQYRARRGAGDRWVLPLFIVVGVLCGVALAGQFGAFGPFGGTVAADPPPVALLSLLAFAAGLQNATVASTTGMSVRTTHLTGPTTDMGMLLGAAWQSEGAARRSALAGAALRGGTVVAFGAGCALAVPATGGLGYLALLVPAGFVGAAGALSFMPEWSPSDFAFDRKGLAPPPDGALAGLPADARPTQADLEREALAAAAREAR
ncbi:MAG TPA: YoaK family protein [Gemmata sp.]